MMQSIIATAVYPLYIVCLAYPSVKRYEVYQDLPP